MTPKQMYSELAKIAGSRCASGESFVRAVIVSDAELRKAQNSILALLDKLNYRRTMEDFGVTPAYEARIRVREESEQRAARRGQDLRAIPSSPLMENHRNIMGLDQMFTAGSIMSLPLRNGISSRPRERHETPCIIRNCPSCPSL